MGVGFSGFGFDGSGLEGRVWAEGFRAEGCHAIEIYQAQGLRLGFGV